MVRYLLLNLIVICFAFGAKAPDISFVGYVNLRDGLGRIPVEMIDALKDRFDVAFTPNSNYVVLNDIPRDVVKIVEKKRPLGRIVFYNDFMHGDDKLLKQLFPKDNPDQIRIAYSMFEATKLPPHWVKQLNKYFDVIAVPDEFLVQVYKDSGIKLPVFVVPHGLDLTPFLKRPLKKERGKVFTFGNYGSCLHRKNHLGLVKAFNRAFGKRDDVRLVLNARTSEAQVKARLERELRKLKAKNIVFQQKVLSKEDYFKRFMETDCLVNLSKGEGFSIQPREAMALGIPTLITDNTAQTTICRTGLTLVVPSRRRVAAYFPGLHGTFGYNFEFDIRDAVRAMVEMVDNYDRYLSMGSKARDWVSQYDYSKITKLYEVLFAPKEVILGKTNRIVGNNLETNCRDLYHKYKNVGL